MGRKKNIEYIKKRTKTILLNKRAYFVWEKLKQDPKFNFTKFVNDKLIEIGGTEEDVSANHLGELQKERDDIEKEYAYKIAQVAQELHEMRNKRVDPF